MNKKLKLYYFEDSLFSYKAFAFAYSKKDAIKFFKLHKTSRKFEVKRLKIKEGFLTDAGGNG